MRAEAGSVALRAADQAGDASMQVPARTAPMTPDALAVLRRRWDPQLKLSVVIGLMVFILQV